MNQTKNKARYLIIGTGRSGSSLLSAILADAGANFAMPNIPSWNKKSGAYENIKLISACKWLNRSHKIAPFSDSLKRFCEQKVMSYLSDLFEVALFAKYPMAVGLTHFIPRLNYQPKVILSCRNFSDYSESMYLKNGIDLSKLRKEYEETNATAFLQLKVFGGCAISYEELINTEETSWAYALANLTGLSERLLIQSRNKRVNKSKKKNNIIEEEIFNSGKNQVVYENLSQLKGRVLQGAL